jgi:pantoate--beta-alanine ligase
VRIVRTVGEMRASVGAATAGSVGLVPTMGAFHAGHVALFGAARSECDIVVASLFVNPAQFAPTDDFARYPRDESRDAEVAAASGVDVLFAPSAEEMYPDGFTTWVDIGAAGSEGAARPGHFRAVATVCVKLFNIVRPERAYFGQKDAQQVAVLEQVVRDLNVPVLLRVVPTVRDEDGLALSSRNIYLSADERADALALPRALEGARAALAAESGSDPIAEARRRLNGGLSPEYVEIVHVGNATLLTAAARVGATRLIDNVLIEGDLQ